MPNSGHVCRNLLQSSQIVCDDGHISDQQQDLGHFITDQTVLMMERQRGITNDNTSIQAVSRTIRVGPSSELNDYLRPTMEVSMSSGTNLPAAQYLRMSTEHQEYSIDNQADAIRKYAEAQGFEIIKTYSDEAKSGLVLKHRRGLAQLLSDVVGGPQPYKAILVYDVSRWGRFQDADESAYYEFVCKSAGLPIHYCAEQFVNDGAMPNVVMKALKRIMAAEYSRDLSFKTFEGGKRISGLGFRVGGPAGYGFRRMLCSSDGTHKQIMESHERKSLATDRVILVPGPVEEIETIRKIFRMVLEPSKAPTLRSRSTSAESLRQQSAFTTKE